MKKDVFFSIIILAAIIAGCTNEQNETVRTTPAGSQETCGDSICGAKEAASGSCPADCHVNTNINNGNEPPAQPTDCVSEGGTIPVIPSPPKCCNGLTLITPKQSSVLGISGICTGKCGNGACDADTESPKNCPADCQAILDTRPICDGIGTTKEGWYQNDKILFYSYCNGCTTECRNKGTASEGWYNTCDNKQIKRMCN
jgi:hypothetical protein